MLRQQRLLTATGFGGGSGKKGGGGGAGGKQAGKTKGGYLIAYLRNDYHTKLHEMRHARCVSSVVWIGFGRGDETTWDG